MSSNTNTNINVPHSSNSIQLNPHDYVNKGINDITLEYFNLINPEQKKSIKSLFIGIGIVIGSDIFKSIIQSLIRENHKSINEFILGGLQIFSFDNFYFGFNYAKNNCFSIINNFSNIFLRKKNYDLTRKNNSIIKSYTIDCDELFIKKLILLVENYKSNKDNYDKIKNIDYIVNCENEIDIKLNNCAYIKNLSDIKINYDDTNFNIQNISYKNNHNGNEIIEIIGCSNINTLYDLFSKEYTEFKELYTYSIAKYDSDGPLLIGCPLLIGGYGYTQNHITPNTRSLGCDILYHIFGDSKYDIQKNQNKINLIVINLYMFISIYNTYRNMINPDIQKNYNSTNNFQLLYAYSEIQGVCCNILLKLSKNFVSLFLTNFEKALNNALKKEVNNNLKKLEIIYDNDEKKIFEFIEYININSKKNKVNKEINIYTIGIEDVYNIEQKVNPEYKKYYETKKTLIEEKKSLEDIIKLIGLEPENYIENKIKKYEIKKKIVNKKYCSFDNLYLRKQQDHQLFNLTDRFINDKKMMEELGIPNKLGILLYGEPGCGKTTSIITISSYLGRDIFYLNLKSVKTNQELKMIFDYVNTEHSGGGVIVLEDIDAMTNIVNKRINEKQNNVTTDLPNINNLVDSYDDSITLEYLLNLLDGTLTFNDSVVIITTNHLDKLDPALYRSGRIDNLIEMKKCDYYQISRIYKRFIKRDIDYKVLNKIPEDTFTPATIIFHLVDWIKKRENPDEIIMGEFIRI